jgi:hypothetical protein
MKIRHIRLAVAGLVFELALCGVVCAQKVALDSNPGVPWPATDALGRSLPTANDPAARAFRGDRFVGIFYFLWHYFLWHDNHGLKRADGDGPYDVSKILARDPQALKHPQSPLWGPPGTYHYWAEPLYGYYLSTDRWVIRRHAQLLAAAGVDTLIFDATNAISYQNVHQALCAEFTAMRKAGNRTPQIAFMVNTQAGATAAKIYKELYEPGLYRDLWFMWRDKPLLICDPSDASPELRAFFTLRRAHWPFTQVNTRDAWHWEAIYPQVYGYTDDPAQPEQVNVSVAQNLRVGDGQVTNMSAGNARGRSFHDGALDRTPGAVARGLNFEEQWHRAINLDPPFVMVTGWNEWIAGRWGKPDGPIEFVDQFDQEFSRDIEPMKGGHGDNYYYQLAANVRRFKGTAPLPLAAEARSIAVELDFSQWKNVPQEYRDDIGDTADRDHDGAGGLHYVNRTGRNDLVILKVASDSENLSFYAQTQSAITLPTDQNGMWLLIDADQNPRTGWEGYDYIVNRSLETVRLSWLEENTGGWNWKRVKTVPLRYEGNQLQLSVPLSALRLRQNASPLTIDFKWVDNSHRVGDIMDAYINGDVAPEGRFRFRYAGKAGTSKP